MTARAVYDPNVLVSAMLSPNGTPAQLVVAWLEGRVELVVSGLLIEELERVLRYPKLAARIAADDADRFVALLEQAVRVEDPNTEPPVAVSDPGDRYLVALAHAAPAYLVTGDVVLLGLAPAFPVLSPTRFAELLARP